MLVWNSTSILKKKIVLEKWVYALEVLNSILAPPPLPPPLPLGIHGVEEEAPKRVLCNL